MEMLGWEEVWPTVLFWLRWVAGYLRKPDAGTRDVLAHFFITADPLASAVFFCLLLSTVVFLLSIPTNNHSWVDKTWSFLPTLYIWHFALHDRLTVSESPLDARLVIMALLGTVWTVRLTYNFARKGGYRWSGEDYRWPWIRAKLSELLPRGHRAAFFLFNLTFIAFYQNLLLLSLAAPAYVAYRSQGAPLNWLDALATAACAFFIAYEAVADQQQWTFQTAKHAQMAAGKRLSGPYARGFLTSGLFRLSRHPNFWAEQSLWWSMYLFGVAASGRWLNWTLAAPVQLTLLFQGSTWLTELITSQKYPGYADYQRTTSCFFPWVSGADALAAAPAARGQKKAGSSKVAAAAAGAATPATPAAAEAEESASAGEEGQEAVMGAAATPSTAVKRRGRGRASKAADSEGNEGEVAGPAEPASSSKAPPRSAKKLSRGQSMTSEEEGSAGATPTRHSSRLRTVRA